jgi:RNA polymerase sigma factor (sigma-70 family)
VALIRLERAVADRAAERGDASRAAAYLRRADELFDAIWPSLRPLAETSAWRFARSARRVGLEPADLVQESYVKGRAVIHQFAPELGTSIDPWLRAVLERHFIGLLRRHKPTAPLPAEDLLPADEDDPTADPLWLHAEVQRLLATALADDPDRRKKISAFLLYCGQGWTMMRLARRFRVSVSTVFRWLGEVKAILRAGLRERFPLETGAAGCCPS